MVMSLRQKIAKRLSPDLLNSEEVRTIVQEEITRAKASMPVTASYDPKNEGYRPLMGEQGQRRMIAHLDRDRMYEVAYFMWDMSAMFRRLARMDKTFIFAEPFTVTSDNENVQMILDRFIKTNKLNRRFPDRMMWMSILGDQCWPVGINPVNGDVSIYYADPVNVAEVYVLGYDPETVIQVEVRGSSSRPAKRLAAVREDGNARSKTYGRLVGEVFYFAINNPPNDPRGRSDFLTLFDWIDGLERYGYNHLDRSEFINNFVWDVKLSGFTEEQIKEWLKNNPPPQPGSVRAHNESVEWDAVAPDLKSTDVSAGFEMIKGFIMGAHGRPDSWFGSGGKAYQTEADQLGQVPIKDLDDRQLFCKEILENICQFQIDQSVLAGRLSEKDAEAGFTANMPEISKKDLAKSMNGVPQIASALAVAETSRWISRDTAIRIFAAITSQLGYEIDVDAEIEAAGKKPPEDEVDYEE